MTLKNTIIVSAITYFSLQFIVWALGVMIWPILWIGLGIASIKICNWIHDEECNCGDGLDLFEKIMIVITGPIIGISAFICVGYRYCTFLKSFKIRNPFTWNKDDTESV